MASSIKPVSVPLEGKTISHKKAAISTKSQWRLLIAVLILNDLLLTGLAFLLAYFVRFTTGFPVFQADGNASIVYYRGVSLLLMVLWVFIFLINGLYDRRNLLGGVQEYAHVFRATTIGLLLIVFTGFLDPSFMLARGWALLAWIFTFALVSSGRFVIRRLVYRSRRKGYFLSTAILVGGNEEGRSLAQQLLRWQTSGLDIIGFADNQLEPGAHVYGRLHTLGKIDQLDHLITKYKVEELILATSALSRQEMLAIFRHFGMIDGLNLRLSSGLFEVITTGLEIKEMAFTPLVRVHKVRLTGFDRLMKLTLDYLIALPAIIFILPLMLILAILVKLDSPGPIIYRRQVVGLNNSQFAAYKFRTMHINGDQILEAYPQLKTELARNHKLKEDPRITRVGHFLRKWSLDELPQLFNVLKQDMSLVGPRMITPSEMKMYDEWSMNLLTVRPGITGLWQVSGRSDVSYEERVRLDMHYIRNWTIWLDLQLLMQTLPAVLKQRGAY